MRGGSTILIVLVVFVLAACGGSGSKGSKSSTVSSSPGPTGSSGPSSSKRAPDRSGSRGPGPRSARPPMSGAGSAFDRSTVRISFREKSFFGAKSQVVYFIAKGGPRRALAQAKACVAMYLNKAPSAYCFAFSSERALRFSRISRRPPAKMQRPCWSAYWGKPSGRRPLGSGSNPADVPLHCPGAQGGAA